MTFLLRSHATHPSARSRMWNSACKNVRTSVKHLIPSHIYLWNDRSKCIALERLQLCACITI